jgi:hypothetical protein
LSTEVSCKEYEVGNEVEIVRLLIDVYNGWPNFDLDYSPLEHWKWKYERDFINRKIIAVSNYKDRIVGVNHSIPVNVKIGEKMLSCYQASDLAIDPTCRGMGLYPRMHEIKTNLQNKYRSHLNYGLSGNPRVIESMNKIGRPKFPRQLISLARIKDVDLHVKMSEMDNPMLSNIGIHVLKTMSNIRRKDKINHRGFQIFDVNSFDEKYSLFWNEVKSNHDFIVKRNPDYLNLRYCDPRGGNYHIKSIEEKSRILGYIVLRINKINAEYPIGYIIDLLSLPDRLDVAESLVIDAMKYFDRHDVNVVRCLVVSGHSSEGLLRRYGFIDSRSRLRLSLLPLDVGSEWDILMKAPANRLHFMYGDTDSI